MLTAVVRLEESIASPTLDKDTAQGPEVNRMRPTCRCESVSRSCQRTRPPDVSDLPMPNMISGAR